MRTLLKRISKRLPRSRKGPAALFKKAVSLKLADPKRLFDVSLSSSLLLASIPVMILIALAVKLSSKGPVFYSQVRVGANRRKRNSEEGFRAVGLTQERRQRDHLGEKFRVLKFRTMKADAEADGKAVWCRKDDPRVTKVGQFLRKTHLDELPQLINILKGEMSVVGPRPERPEFVSQLKEKVLGYEKRLQSKPGMTGLAQIYYRADEDISDVKKKIRYDLLYQKKASWMTDMKIVLGTVPVMFGSTMDHWKLLNKDLSFLYKTRVNPDVRMGYRTPKINHN